MNNTILVGSKFSRLTVRFEIPRTKRSHPRSVSIFQCLCDCGKECKAKATELLNGAKKSCGCFKKTRLGIQTSTHGLSKTREYKIYIGMKKRCLNPKDKSYPRYGGRGITISKEWLASFDVFLKDMGKCPEKFSLERKDNSKGYSKQNCIWASASEQSRNTRRNRLLTVKGITKTLTEWSELSGNHRKTITTRIDEYGWNHERAIFEKLQYQR